MHNKFKPYLLALLLIHPAFAQAQSSQPKYCPGIEAIKAVPVTAAVDDGVAGWLAYNPVKNKYDTGEEWTFMMMLGGAHGEQDAIMKANTNMAMIEYVDGPKENKETPVSWGCLYFSRNSDNGFLAYAVTPPYVGLPELARQFRR